ncbi:MAG: acetate kinase [Nakamurella sp.]
MTAYTLVLNAGSSSLKYQLVEPVSGHVAAKGLVERIGRSAADYTEALAKVQADLPDVTITAVGHRVVHGGDKFSAPTMITPSVLGAIKELIPLAPLHNPANAAIIDAALVAFAGLPQVAVFDTAFFADLPKVATTYAIDRNVARDNGIRRYGFHGISHEYVSKEAAKLLGRDYGELNQIVLHLGNGASASAIEAGRPIDTSMGLTPLEGLVMGTRGGDIDPGVLIHLMRHAHLDADGIDDLLSRHSGMFGLTGSVDLRDVHAAAAGQGPDSEQAELALAIYARRLAKYIGGYAAILGSVDIITFTAGVGENDADIRERACARLDLFGVILDSQRNRLPAGGPRVISADDSRVTVAMIPTNEELAIARQAAASLVS